MPKSHLWPLGHPVCQSLSFFIHKIMKSVCQPSSGSPGRSKQIKEAKPMRHFQTLPFLYIVSTRKTNWAEFCDYTLPEPDLFWTSVCFQSTILSWPYDVMFIQFKNFAPFQVLMTLPPQQQKSFPMRGKFNFKDHYLAANILIIVGV